MKEQNKMVLAIVFILLLTMNQEVLASDDPFGVMDGSFDDDTLDEAPINGLVYIALAIGGYFGFKKIK